MTCTPLERCREGTCSASLLRVLGGRYFLAEGTRCVWSWSHCKCVGRKLRGGYEPAWEWSGRGWFSKEGASSGDRESMASCICHSIPKLQEEEEKEQMVVTGRWESSSCHCRNLLCGTWIGLWGQTLRAGVQHFGTRIRTVQWCVPLSLDNLLHLRGPPPSFV